MAHMDIQTVFSHLFTMGPATNGASLLPIENYLGVLHRATTPPMNAGDIVKVPCRGKLTSEQFLGILLFLNYLRDAIGSFATAAVFYKYVINQI